MYRGIAAGRRPLVAGLIAAAVPAAAVALMAGPPATGAIDPCAASEVARTIGSVAKSMGDYLDAHPQTNQSMTTMLQQAGPQSADSLKSYFATNPRAAVEMAGITQPLNNLSAQCKLPISLPQAMGLMQQAPSAGGQTGGLPPSPAAGLGTLPVGAAPGTPPAATAPPVAGGTLPGPSRQNNVG